MVLVAHSSPSLPFEGLSAATSLGSSDSVPSTSFLVPHYYLIKDLRQSECTQILFTQNINTGQRLVMKILRDYKDARYSLETISKRQQCQLKALERNKVYTLGGEVYIGLARIKDLDLSQSCILIDEIINNPTKGMLDSNAEYALVMHQLAEERRLDHILSEESRDALRKYIYLLAQYLSYIHTHFAAPLVANENGIHWGSHEQLQRKLVHNFEPLDLVLAISKNSRGNAYDLLKNRLTCLKNRLNHMFSQYKYKQYFEQRLLEHRIKRCHGDLKSPHIWITSPDEWREQEPWKDILILDAADFNPLYTNIDVLSDLALLAVDIQARTGIPLLADLLTENYLQITNQKDEASRGVLAFYLVEKAIVGAAMSIVYDNLPDLGWAFLETAEMRLKCLIESGNIATDLIEDLSNPARSLEDLPVT